MAYGCVHMYKMNHEEKGGESSKIRYHTQILLSQLHCHEQRYVFIAMRCATSFPNAHEDEMINTLGPRYWTAAANSILERKAIQWLGLKSHDKSSLALRLRSKWSI